MKERLCIIFAKYKSELYTSAGIFPNVFSFPFKNFFPFRDHMFMINQPQISEHAIEERYSEIFERTLWMLFYYTKRFQTFLQSLWIQRHYIATFVCGTNFVTEY